MSLVVETEDKTIQGLIKHFITESTEILDTSVNMSRRVALLYKWSWVLHGLGYPRPLDTLEIDEDTIREKISDMLKWVANIIKNTG